MSLKSHSRMRGRISVLVSDSPWTSVHISDVLTVQTRHWRMRCSSGLSGTIHFTLHPAVAENDGRILVNMDRSLSTIMGRPCCIQEEE